MTTPHEAVAKALHLWWGNPYIPVTNSDKSRATTAIEALREGAEERLRKAIPNVGHAWTDEIINAILGPAPQLCSLCGKPLGDVYPHHPHNEDCEGINSGLCQCDNDAHPDCCEKSGRCEA